MFKQIIFLVFGFANVITKSPMPIAIEIMESCLCSLNKSTTLFRQMTSILKVIILLGMS